MKTSEELKHFLDYVRQCEAQYDLASEQMEKENQRLQDFLHAIEFEAHAEARSKVATQLRASRLARRQAKDTVEELEPVVEFVRDPRYKGTFDQLAQLLGRVRKVEKYHANRAYRPRGGQ